MDVLASFSLKGKVALLTGGAGKYGRQIVAALAEAGAETYIASRNLEALEKVAAEERARGYDVTALQLDLEDEKSIFALHEELMRRCGRIDDWISSSEQTAAVNGSRAMAWKILERS